MRNDRFLAWEVAGDEFVHFRIMRIVFDGDLGPDWAHEIASIGKNILARGDPRFV
jgi:hypothetical protein